MSSDISREKTLQNFRNLFPFLKRIPDQIYFQLSTKELYLPSSQLYSFILELADILNHHVITYNANIFDLSIPPQKHLCARLKGAVLSLEQKKLLDSYEKITKKQGISLVVYQKPVQLVDIQQTALYYFYKENKLL